MVIDTAENPVNVVIDTNIIISGVGFGGKPRKILHLILEDKIKAVTSPILLAELEDVIVKKFPKLNNSFESIKKQIKSQFKIVKPRKSLFIVKDDDDNRVLEAANEGNCKYVITGDNDLLELKSYKNIKILTADEFLEDIKTDRR